MSRPNLLDRHNRAVALTRTLVHLTLDDKALDAIVAVEPFGNTSGIASRISVPTVRALTRASEADIAALERIIRLCRKEWSDAQEATR